jgi:GNAT superfamily N-acetyltransferase
MESIGFVVYPKSAATNAVLAKCAANFNSHYGVWRDESKGRRRSGWSPPTWLTVAFDGHLDTIVGHAFVTPFESSLDGKITWITQLVVDPSYRSRKIAQNLISCGISTECADAALVSSHPHAVLALERALGKNNCDPAVIEAVGQRLMSESGIDYLRGAKMHEVPFYCSVDTHFPINHAEPLAALRALPAGRWQLGPLLEGHEFLAIVCR